MAKSTVTDKEISQVSITHVTIYDGIYTGLEAREAEFAEVFRNTIGSPSDYLRLAAEVTDFVFRLRIYRKRRFPSKVVRNMGRAIQPLLRVLQVQGRSVLSFDPETRLEFYYACVLRFYLGIKATKGVSGICDEAYTELDKEMQSIKRTAVLHNIRHSEKAGDILNGSGMPL